MMMGSHWGGAWMAGHGLWMLLFWTLVIVAVVALLRGLRSGGKTDPVGGADRLRRLEQCYARGELDSEQFRRRRRDLDGSA